MDAPEFKIRCAEVANFICKYYENISDYKVFPSVKPGYLAPLLPREAPMKPEKWEDIMKDIEVKIMPGITHWQHPRFFAYFPNGRGFPSLLADMLSDAFGVVGFSWASSPSCTELETIVLDWYGKALNIPDFFLYFTPGSIGGGVIQGSASECILVSMLAARDDAIKYLKKESKDTEKEDNEFLVQLVAYTSSEAHSCVEKAAKICMVKLRLLVPDKECSLRGPTLAEAMEDDVKKGLHPFFVSATLGTTGCVGFDNLKEIGPIVSKHKHCWLHVDAAYAGNSFICPELRYLKEGLEHAHSFNTNCNKFLNVCYDCSCLWIKDRYKLISALSVEPVYLQHDQASVTLSYRHWMIPLSRRFRSLKLWFTLRIYGIEKLQNYIRNHIALAKVFEKLVRQDNRFEVCNVVRLGLVCFRLKARDEINQELLASINKEGSMHMVPCVIHNKFVIRFCVTYEKAKESDITTAWSAIQYHASEVLKRQNVHIVSTATIEERRRLSFVQAVPPNIYEQIKKSSILSDETSLVYIPEIAIDSVSFESALDEEDS